MEKKKITKALALLALIFITTICGVQASSYDYYEAQRLRLLLQLKDAGITADKEAMEYIFYFSEATHHPGKKILVKKETDFLQLLSVSRKLIRINKKEIVYNNSERIIYLIKSSEEKEKNSFLVLLVALSIVLMVISNILFAKRCSRSSEVIALIAAFAVFLATFDATTQHLVISISIIATLFILFLIGIIDDSHGIISMMFGLPIMLLLFVLVIIVMVQLLIAGPIFLFLFMSGVFATIASCYTEYWSVDPPRYMEYSVVYYVLIVMHLTLLFIVY